MHAALRRGAAVSVQRVALRSSLPVALGSAARLMSRRGSGPLAEPPQAVAAAAAAAAAAHAAPAAAQTARDTAAHAPAAAASAPTATARPTAQGWGRTVVAVLLTLAGTLAAAWLTGSVHPDRTSSADAARKNQQAATAESFRQRRVAAVKERLKRSAKGVTSPHTTPSQPAPAASQAAEEDTLPLFERPDAMRVVAPIVTKAGLYMLCGPKGEGKCVMMQRQGPPPLLILRPFAATPTDAALLPHASLSRRSSLMELLERQHPFVIRADLQNGSLDQAVRAVAAAMGYSLHHTADEVAAKAAGFKVPHISAVQTATDFQELLLAFEQACNELRAEGVLGGHVPVLILE
jgi:hypothetical protein